MDKVFMFEIPVNNVTRATAFYKSVFGWQVESWDGAYGVRTVAEDANWVPKEKGAINGEMYRREKKGDGPVLVVLVPSIARTIARVKKAGGRVLAEKEPYGAWGYYARIKDREGNVFGLWEKMK